MRETTTTLDTALELHGLGYNVIPLCGPDHVGSILKPCPSPGKIPHGRGWNKYGEVQSRTEVEQLFRRHKGNVGIVPQRHQIVLDVDPRAFADGVNSFTQLCDDLSIPPMETPHAFTGGGGDHWYMTLPGGTQLPAGGDLSKAGYPGVEWKALGGQVVAAPSVHASGGSYIWEIELEPDAVEPVEIPDDLLQLILNVRDNIYDSPEAAPRQTKAQNDGVRGQRWTRSQRLGFFAESYGEGSRRVSSGLPRLVGILGSQHVCESCTARFMDWWQQSHFNPPIDPNELAASVASMYGRYGYDGMHCDHGEKGFLKDVTAISMGNPNSPEVQEAATKLIEQAAIDEEKATRRARSEAQNKALYGARSRFRPATSSGQNAEFPPIEIVVGGKLRTSGTETPLLLHAPSAYVLKDRLEELILAAEGEDSQRAQTVHECGFRMGMNCSTHGERFVTTKTCNQATHANCPTSLGEKVRQVSLDDMTDGGQYREVWLYAPVNMARKAHLDQAAFKAMMKKYQEVIAKASRRRAWAGLILHRAISFYLKIPTSWATFKFMVQEETAGDADELIAFIQKELGAGFAAEKTYTSGELAVTQLYEDSMTVLAGMDDESDVDLFQNFYFATKGGKFWQGMSVLWAKLKEVKKDEPARCDICQERLSAVVVDPTIEANRRATEAEYGGHNTQYGLVAAD